ncbi:glutamate receptor 2.7-like [Coffea eugenioides]|uniref:glutamate receptor 2.7-like n=1 Tax=Coffea eugenioides TaxID=49369 RepID=UPI000F60FF46|nr:glutamate receptor 2.7-like [Coffea eugenioides]
MQNPVKSSTKLLYLHLIIINFWVVLLNGQNATKVDVGVILDLDTLVGKISKTSMLMALEDHRSNNIQDNTTIRIVAHLRDSKSDSVEAASAAIDLLKNVQVEAILGPQTSAQADFIIDLGNKAKVPVISSAASPSLSPKESPFFVRAAHCSSSQATAIAEIIKTFGWRKAVLVYEDSLYGSGIVPFLTDAMLESNTIVSYRSVISPAASDDQILEELYKLITMQTRVFVVHLLPSLASRLFLKANEVGMMSQGYAWIITEALTSLLDSVKPAVVDSMQGVLGLKPHVPRSSKLDIFTKRWRKRFREENPEIDRFELNIYGLWAYDTVIALAKATEKAVNMAQPQSKKKAVINGKNLSDLDMIGTSGMGAELIESVRNIRFNGLSGDFHIIEGQLQPSAFEIVNVIGKGERKIGFWTETYGISDKLKPNEAQLVHESSKDNIGIIIWPGESNIVPKGWEMPTGHEKKLRVGVPVKNGLPEFVKVEKDPVTNAVIATGFCVDVFKEVMTSLPYAASYDFIPFETPDGDSAGDYNDLVYQIYLENYDAVVGDVTILANRSRFVDFTLPYTESGVSTIVRIMDDERKNAWIFMKPLTMDLWLTTGAFFIFTGFVVWVLEHRINEEFRGPPGKQVGMIFWFSFSTLVFAHKEKVMSNLSRFVVIIWVFVVLVLTSSYTASLTSMLTVQQLQPTITDLFDLTKNGEYIGYQTGSFVTELLKSKKFDASQFRNYNTFEEYDEALRKGSRNGGVDGIVDELPYIRLFLAKYCRKYTMVGPTFQTAGFGFAFPKGSPLVPDVSRAVLNVTEGDKMKRILKEWFGEETDCSEQYGAVATSDSLTLDSFKGLFLIAGLSSSLALAIFLLIFLYENRGVLVSNGSVVQKLSAMAKIFDEERKELSRAAKKQGTGAEAAVVNVVSLGSNHEFAPSPAISFFHHHHQHHEEEGVCSHDEGFSTATEPASPMHDAIVIVTETAEER